MFYIFDVKFLLRVIFICKVYLHKTIYNNNIKLSKGANPDA